MSNSHRNYLVCAIFAALHALCCITCRSLGVADSFVLTLLTIVMVIILCSSKKLKLHYTLASVIGFIVLAYLLGNAFPKLLIPVTGGKWAYPISTFSTTLFLGCVFEYISSKVVRTAPRARWIVHINDRIVPVKTEQIAYFVSEDKYNYLVTSDGSKFITDSTMDSIMSELDPNAFFRISRGCIVSLSCIDSVTKDTGHYVVEVHPKNSVALGITKSRVQAFMEWLG